MFKWFKSLISSQKEIFTDRVLIYPILQENQQLDFVYKEETTSVPYLFDLSKVLKLGEAITKLEFQCGDSSLSLKNLVIKKLQFDVEIEGGIDNCKSTIVFQAEIDQKRVYTFTVLVVVINHYKLKSDQENAKRNSRLWTLTRNPILQDVQPDNEPWIEGDMILNIENHYLWEYRMIDEHASWVPLFVMLKAIEPVVTTYSDIRNSGERLVMNHIHSDQGKIKSDSKGNLSVVGDFVAKSIRTQSIVAGHPLGEGMLFTSSGMIAGHSLYIGSPDASPKNIYMGVPGVVSTKLVSADYLQLTPLSTKDFPTHVTKGTLVLCTDYPDYFGMVLMCSSKDNPQILEDWKPLFHENLHDKQHNIRESFKPYLYTVASNPEVKAHNVVELKPTVKTTINSSSDKDDVKHLGTDTFMRIQFEAEKIGVSQSKDTRWHQLTISDVNKQIKGDGKQYWSANDNNWTAPASGLFNVQGKVIFSEVNVADSNPILYHTGDLFLLSFANDMSQIKEISPITKLDFSLSPFVNDVTHRVCAHQNLTFVLTFPVKKGDIITINSAYIPQHASYGYAENLPIEKAIFDIFMS